MLSYLLLLLTNLILYDTDYGTYPSLYISASAFLPLLIQHKARRTEPSHKSGRRPEGIFVAKL